MNKFLRKIFIKDYKNVNDPKVRTKHGYLAAFFGIISNLLLFAFKLLIGIITSSISIITDAVNNLSDSASSVVSVVGFKLASKPADKKHPFGHERIEYIAGLIVSFVIIMIAGVLGYMSVMKIIKNESTEINFWVFIILGVAILIKIWQSTFYKYIAKQINSVTLKASAQDSLNDVISTSCVLIISIIEFSLSKNNIKIPFSLDGVVGICLSVFIIIMGIKLIFETANPLIGLTPDHDLVKKIVKEIVSYDGVLGVHDLMCHSYGPTKIFMTIHVEVDARSDILKSHDLIDTIESEVGKNNNVILTIHMDPIDNYSKDVLDLKEKVSIMLKTFSNSLTFHDFRLVKGDSHTNILFDVLVPQESNIDEEKLKEYLNTEIKKIDKKFNLVLKIDKSYL